VSGAFTLLFHDTHHRAVSAPHEIGIFDIDAYDGVLVFGEVLREVYLAHGWARQVFTLHEAADTELFRPLPGGDKDADLIWVGNWGDGERSAELHEFLLEPVSRLGLKARKDILVAGSTRDVLNILQDMPEERRKAIAAAGRRCVLQNHTAQHRAQQLETYYREAMASRPRRPIEAVA